MLPMNDSITNTTPSTNIAFEYNSPKELAQSFSNLVSLDDIQKFPRDRAVDITICMQKAIAYSLDIDKYCKYDPKFKRSFEEYHIKLIHVAGFLVKEDAQQIIEARSSILDYDKHDAVSGLWVLGMGGALRFLPIYHSAPLLAAIASARFAAISLGTRTCSDTLSPQKDDKYAEDLIPITPQEIKYPRMDVGFHKESSGIFGSLKRSYTIVDLVIQADEKNKFKIPINLDEKVMRPIHVLQYLNVLQYLFIHEIVSVEAIIKQLIKPLYYEVTIPRGESHSKFINVLIKNKKLDIIDDLFYTLLLTKDLEPILSTDNFED